MTFTAQMRLVVTLFVIALVSTVGIVSYAAGASNQRASDVHADEVLFGCEVVNVEDSTADYTALLASIGYKGVPGDGVEAMYSPGCDF